MKKTIYSVTAILLASTLACGRPSTSNFFVLDGVGDPNQPIVGNPLPGKYGGTIEVASWQFLQESYQLFGTMPDGTFSFSQAFLNRKDIAGIGGWDLIVIAIPAVPRLGVNDQALCYMDPEALPLLGGALESADVGQEIDLDFGAENFEIQRDDDSDVASDDLLLWLSNHNTTTDQFPYDQDVDLSWSGGTLGGLGFPEAPPLNDVDVIHFPENLILTTTSAGTPTINNDRMSDALVPIDTQYHFEWDEADDETDLMGTQIVMTVYGPTNLGDSENFESLPDNPFFNRLARMVCIVRDQAEEFTIFQSDADQTLVDAGLASPFTVDDLMEMTLASGKYPFSTEDANGNGELDTRPGTGVPPIPIVEDGNGNGVIDKIYGIAVSVNRRTERDMFFDMGNGRDSKVLVTGNSLKMTKMEFGAAPPAP